MSFHNIWIWTSVTSPPSFHAIASKFQLEHQRCTQLSSSFVRLCWRRMLQAKCSPALWVTKSKEAPRHRGFSVYFCLLWIRVCWNNAGAQGGWLGGLLEQLIPDNVQLIPPLNNQLCWARRCLWHRIYLLFCIQSPYGERNLFTCFSRAEII